MFSWRGTPRWLMKVKPLCIDCCWWWVWCCCWLLLATELSFALRSRAKLESRFVLLFYSSVQSWEVWPRYFWIFTRFSIRAKVIFRFNIWLEVSLVISPQYFSSWFWVNSKTHGSINGSYCCTFMLKYCISIDREALLARYDSSSADFF